MERAEWLRQMRAQAEALYDRLSPAYWVSFGLYENETHREFLRKFLDLVKPGNRARQPGVILSAACGAGRYDGFLLEAGHSVVGIDQSEQMLARAREHFPLAGFPRLRYEQMGLQEIAQHPAYQAAFDGAVCIDAMEHVCPEDWPAIVRGLQGALKPGGALYITVETAGAGEVEAAYQRAIAQGLPVVPGEVVDELQIAYEKLQALGLAGLSGQLADAAVYHYHPSLSQARAWFGQAGLSIVEEGDGSGYHHFLLSYPPHSQSL